MNKYEAMFILKPDLSEEEKKTLLGQITDAVVKRQGTVLQASVWADRKKLFFPLKRFMEGVYYLMNFSASPSSISEIRQAYRLNESILRVLITRVK